MARVGSRTSASRRRAVAAGDTGRMSAELPPTRWPGPPTAYLPIAEHGLIGDLHTAAMVGSDGTIDWFCPQRFDGPSVFAALLDREHGGFYRIAPADPLARTKQLYLPDTNVLVTRFLSPHGVSEIQDFMPVGERPAAARPKRGWSARRVAFSPAGRAALRLRPARAAGHDRADRRRLSRRGRRSCTRLAARARGDLRRSHGRVRARGGRADDVRPSGWRSGGAARRAGGGAAGRRNRQVLARVASAVLISRPLARDSGSLSTDAQAALVRAERRDHGRRDREPARANRRNTKLGLPLRVVARLRVLRYTRCPGLDSSRRRSRSTASAARSRARPRRRRAAAHSMSCTGSTVCVA